MARLRYLQNKRSGTAGTISKSDKRIYFFDDNAYIYAASSGVLHIVATTINIDGNFAFTGTDKLHLGTSTAPLTLTEGIPVLQVYTNCSSEHASTTAVPSYFCANMDTAAGVGRALEAVLTVEDVKLGSWSNAIKGKIDFETSGSGAGLMSAICAEMIMPAATMGGYGNYAPLEIEFVCPLTWAGSPQSVSFMNINLAVGSTGDTTGNFDDIGYLMVVNGLDDNTTHCLYNNTLKMKVGTTTWYLPMSSAQGSFTTAYPIVTTYATTAVDIGACVTGISITNASTYAIQIVTNGRFIMGTMDDGIPLETSKLNAMEVHTEPSADLTQDETGISCGIRSRYQVSAAQSSKISMIALEGRLRVKAALGDGCHAGVCGTIEAGKDSDTIAFTGTSTTQRSAGNFCVELSAQSTLANSGWLTGVTIDSSVHGSVDVTTTCTFAGLRIKTSSEKEPWTYGIYMGDDDAVTGIYIGSCTTAGITSAASIGVTIAALTVGDSYSGVRSEVTAATANNSYGAAGYFQTTVTGTQGGAFVYGLGSWINMADGIVAAGRFLVAQDNGIYQSGTTTCANAKFVFGMRMERLLTGTTTNVLTFPFSLNTSNDGITALFDCSTAADLGSITDAGTDDGTLVPFYRDGNGNIRYVKAYTLA